VTGAGVVACCDVLICCSSVSSAWMRASSAAMRWDSVWGGSAAKAGDDSAASTHRPSRDFLMAYRLGNGRKL
jgi:hypothetical protein